MATKNRNRTMGEQLMRIGRQMKQGATFGFADEIQDIPAAAYASLVTGERYSDLLKEARENSREQLADDWQEYPVTSMAAQMAGSVPWGLGKYGKAATDWVRTGDKIQRIKKGATLGAGYGAASGLGSSDDTAYDRISSTLGGTIIGGIIGGPTALLGKVGGAPDNIDYRKVVGKTAKDFENKAQKELARQLSARPDLAEQLARTEANMAASQSSNIPLTLAEALAQSPSDPLLAQQAVLATNPMTAGRMSAMYSGRSGTPAQAGAIENRLTELARQLDPNVGSYDEAAQAVIGRAGESARGITRDLVNQAKPLYQQAYQANVAADDAILANPLIRDAINKAKGNPVYAQEIGNLPDNSIQALDIVKRSLDDMAQSAQQAGNRNEARLIGQAREQLLASMDAASPEYAQARAVYSGNPTALQIRERIGTLADIDPLNARAVGQQLFSGTQQNADLAAQALGERAPTAAAARIYGAMDELRNDPVNLAGRIAPDERTRDMLRSYAGQQYAPLEETLNVINQAKLGERMRYGSPTQPRMEAEKGLEQAANLGIDVATGGKTAIMRKVASLLGRGSQETDPQFYADMADLMLTEKGLDLMRRVASGQQTAITELQNASLPSVIGGAAARLSGFPAAQSLVNGMFTPIPQQQNPSQILPMQQNENGLPPGFVVEDGRRQLQTRKKTNELPAGFIIEE